jgi:hypothetical protein
MLDPERPNRTKNALTHGVYSSEILLPGESEEDFVELYDGLRSELNPGSRLEDEAVLDLTRLHWLKRRAMQAAKRQLSHQQQLGHMSAADQMEFLNSTLSFKAKFLKALKRVDELLRTISAEHSTTRPIKDCSTNCELFIAELRSHTGYFSKIRRLVLSDKHQAAATYVFQPADLECVVKVEALIDTRIDKVLARLAGIKEFRRLYGKVDVASTES